MKTNAIIFDLDDTLIDTRKRHFNIAADFLNTHEKVLNFKEYLGLRKRNNWSNKEFIKRAYALNEDEFFAFWQLNVENPKYLKYDFEIVNSKLLKELKVKGSFDFFLLSLRNNFQSAEDQFKNFSFSLFFEDHYFLKHASLNPKIEKLKSFKESYRNVTFVSDSSEDCNAATEAGVEFVGVQTGVYDIVCKNQFMDINSFLLKQNSYVY